MPSSSGSHSARPSCLARRPDGLSFYVYDTVTQRMDGQHYYVEDGGLRPSPIESATPGRRSWT